jgi:hypothetical protein
MWWPAMPRSTTGVTTVRSRIPTWPHIPRIFTRPSHFGFVVATNPLFSRSGRAFRVYTIPIARPNPPAMLIYRGSMLQRRR